MHLQEEGHAMDLTDGELLYSGLAISLIRLALFVHGKKMDKAAKPRYRPGHDGLSDVRSLAVVGVGDSACVASIFLLPDGR